MLTTERNARACGNGIQGAVLAMNGDLPASAVPHQPAWEWNKLRKVARRQVDKFITLVPDTLRDENLEAVNEMRITSRRLEQILDLLYPKPRPRRIKKLRRRLKACRDALGELRNDDALLAMVNQSAALKAPSSSEVLAAVREYLQERRQQNARLALQKLGQINLTASYLTLRRDLDSDAPLRRATKNGSRNQILLDGGKMLVKERISDSLGRLWHAFEALVEKSRSDPREKVIHQMRIAAKRLRYLTEAMEKLRIDGSSEIAGWLRTFQRIVGEWHDRELLEDAINEMVGQSSFRQKHAGLRAEMQKLAVRNHEIKEALEHKFCWMTQHSHHYNETKKWVLEFLANGNGELTVKH